MALISDYILVTEASWDFVQEIKRHLADGWQPLGGPFSCLNGRIWQAIVKYEPSATDTAIRKYSQERYDPRSA